MILLLPNVTFLEGFLPVASRAVVYSLLVSRGVRENAQLYMFFREERKCLLFEGSKVRHVMPDEQSLGGILKKAAKAVKGYGSSRVHWGVRLIRLNFAALLRKVGGRLRIFAHPRGKDLRALVVGSDLSAVIPFFTEYTGAELEELKRQEYEPVDGGLSKLYPDQTIAVLQLAADRGVKGA